MTTLNTNKPRTKTTPLPPSLCSCKKPLKPTIAKSVKSMTTIELPPIVNLVKATHRQAEFIQLMRRSEGISLYELMKISGWQAHSIRGWISGTLRKKQGLVVSRFKSESGDSCYRIEPVSVIS